MLVLADISKSMQSNSKFLFFCIRRKANQLFVFKRSRRKVGRSKILHQEPADLETFLEQPVGVQLQCSVGGYAAVLEDRAPASQRTVLWQTASQAGNTKAIDFPTKSSDVEDYLPPWRPPASLWCAIMKPAILLIGVRLEHPSN